MKDTFHEALRRESGDRDRFLDDACRGDIDLRIEVESLLISLTEAKSFLEEPVISELPAPEWQLAEGQSISHYRVVAPIASGGMGEVYLCEDERLNRQVAIKVLPADLLQNKERLRRFEREANVVSALNHPNILTVFEFGDDRDMHFLATEYVRGETLRSRLDQGPMKLREALEISVQIASALKAAHDAGVVHRDIKPENVMIRDDGYVKVLDFGLAKLAEQAFAEAGPAAQLLSRPGIILGTVMYMSPEQARGVNIDPRSDLFSFGVLLYEMVAGRVPFSGETKTDVIAAIIQLEPPPAASLDPSLPPEVDGIIRKCIEKDRSSRYQTADELSADLKALLRSIDDDGKVTAPEPPKPEAEEIESAAAEPAAERSGMMPLFVILCVAAVLAAAVIAWGFW